MTNVKIFVNLPKEVPMGYKNTLLPDPLLKNHSVKSLSYQGDTQKPYIDSLDVPLEL